MVKVIHFHYNSSKNVNIGDEAHVLAIQDTLRQEIKNVEIANYPISFLCHYQLPKSFISQHLPLSAQNAARILRGKSYSQLIKEINDADLIIIGGGGVYMDHLLPFSIPLLHRITTPIVIFGAGYNRNFGSTDFDKHQVESIKVLGQQATLQSVRDTNTQAFLNQLGVTSELVGDPAIFLEKAPSTTTLANPKKLTIGINIAAHGWKLQPKFEAILVDAYVSMMHAIQKRHKTIFRYFIHHPGEYRMIEALERKGILFDTVIDTDARKTKAAYAAVDLTVSMMLHSTILAFGEGKPSICIGYDDKNKSFMDLTKQAKRYIRVDELSEDILMQKVEGTIATLSQNTTRVQAEHARLKDIYSNFSQRVGNLVR